jgi:hypothetical protein
MKLLKRQVKPEDSSVPTSSTSLPPNPSPPPSDKLTVRMSPSNAAIGSIFPLASCRSKSEDKLRQSLPLPAPPDFPSSSLSKLKPMSTSTQKDSCFDRLANKEIEVSSNSIQEKDMPLEFEGDERIAIQALLQCRGKTSASTAKSGFAVPSSSSSSEAILPRVGKKQPPTSSHVMQSSRASTTIQQYQRLAAASTGLMLPLSSVTGTVECIEPRDSDILCYRGACIRNHPGTTEYRDLVRLHQPRYCVCTEREKRNIAILIVLKLRSQGRRFLTKGVDGVWFDIGDPKAVKKASQALREGQAERRLLITKSRTAVTPSKQADAPVLQTGSELKGQSKLPPIEPFSVVTGRTEATRKMQNNFLRENSLSILSEVLHGSTQEKNSNNFSSTQEKNSNNFSS